ncbi:tRNA processing endoribonuclease [Hirsutella rhossiliensis]|uniref:tRNA processing endoribonuclease Trz1 n=1 Tax=Hirsutella rhossiliensis TaxID=111463 RepID=A0A9P8N8Y3_9HYPO|nr:tRNA processing endoribonuclease Trz1 [Hirsutella rhossiliensis]KAH0966807.1 tRNA processing endoribonuclease Trz1 [Hirsutella rhossiliensis]
MQAIQKGPKACTTCAKAKARCIPRTDGGDKCERCHRLNKDCFSRLPAPPRVKKRPKRSRVAELEKRLNELSSHIEGQHAVAPTRDQAPEPPVKAPEKGDLLSLEHLFPSPRSSGWESSNDTLSWSPGASRSADSAWPLPGEAEAFLSRFHDAFAHLFPFVVVPKHITAAELRTERPLVWKGVMVAGCIWDGARQAKLGEEMLADVAKAAISDGIKTLDLLQGLELLLAWFHFALKSSQTSHLLFLARSMCVNLNAMSYGSTVEDAKYGRLDHLRAYAGMYYLNTLIFTTNKRNDVLMNTTQLDSYCKIIETTNEYPSDEYLIKLIRIQQLAQTISLTMAFDPATPAAMSLPLPMVIESFQDQLDTFRVTLPTHLAASPTLQCHISIAEVLLTDVAISDPHCDSYNIQLTDRLQLLWACVRSLKAFFKVRFAVTELDSPRFVTVMVSDVAFAFITGIKLLTLGVPGWNLEHVSKELALDDMLSRQIDDLTEIIAKRKSGSPSSQESSLEDPLERLQRLLRTAQELVALQLSGVSAQEIGQAVVGEMNSATWQDLMNDDAASMPC